LKWRFHDIKILKSPNRSRVQLFIQELTGLVRERKDKATAMLARLVFRPSRQPIPTPKHPLLLDAPWGKIQVWTERTPACGNAEPEVFLLRFLGARGRAEMGTTDPLNRAPDAKGEVWIANPPGFGTSTGPISLPRYAAAALRVFDALRQRAAGRPVWVYGQSFGTTAALHVAAQRQIDWLVLKNVTPARQILRLHLPRGFQWIADTRAMRLPPELDAHRNAALAQAPALFLTSRHDQLAPPALQAAIRDAYQGPSELCLINATHDQHLLEPDDDRRYAAFVLRALQRAGADAHG
jgi:pimeloyl-ACP methyl ester carboxylesterase